MSTGSGERPAARRWRHVLLGTGGGPSSRRPTTVACACWAVLVAAHHAVRVAAGRRARPSRGRRRSSRARRAPRRPRSPPRRSRSHSERETVVVLTGRGRPRATGAAAARRDRRGRRAAGRARRRCSRPTSAFTLRRDAIAGRRRGRWPQPAPARTPWAGDPAQRVRALTGRPGGSAPGPVRGLVVAAQGSGRAPPGGDQAGDFAVATDWGNFPLPREHRDSCRGRDDGAGDGRATPRAAPTRIRPALRRFADRRRAGCGLDSSEVQRARHRRARADPGHLRQGRGGQRARWSRSRTSSSSWCCCSSSARCCRPCSRSSVIGLAMNVSQAWLYLVGTAGLS